jgi:hypothetical protein
MPNYEESVTKEFNPPKNNEKQKPLTEGPRAFWSK